MSRKQIGLFGEPGEVRAVTAKAIAKAEKPLSTPEGRHFREIANNALRRVAERQTELTTDDVWSEIGTVIDKFASQIGIVMRDGAKSGVITITDRTRKSERPSRHANRLPVWQSKLVGGEDGVRAAA
jgi:hypothetical protein